MKYPYLLFFLSLSLLSFSQKTENDKIIIDSLLVVLNTKREDTAKVNVYQTIFEYCLLHDYEKSNLYNNKILTLSQKTQYKRGIGFYYLNLWQINEFIGKDRIEDSNKAKIIFSKVHDIRYYLMSCYANGLTNLKLHKLELAKAAVNEGLRVGLNTKFYVETGDLYTLMGQIYYRNSDLRKALIYYKKALEVFNKSSNSKEYKIGLYLYIAFVFTDMGDYKESIKYIDFSNEILETPNNNLEKASALIKLKSYEEALKVLNRNKKLDFPRTQLTDNYNASLIAEVYYNLKKYSLAIKELEVILKKENLFDVKIKAINLLANCYFKQKNLSKAKQWNDKALIMADSSKILDKARESIFCLKSEIDEARGDFRSSLLYLKKYYQLKTENNTKNTEDKIHQYQIDFQVAEKDNNIKNLQIQELKKSSQLKKQSNYLIAGALFLLVALSFVLFFLWLNKSIKRQKQIIENNNIDLITERYDNC